MKPLNKTEREEIIHHLAEELTSPDNAHVFSGKYKEHRASLIFGHKKSRPHRAAVVILIVILSIVLIACSESVRKFLTEVYDTFTNYSVTGMAYPIADLYMEIPEPDGYILTEKTTADYIYTAVYHKKGSDTDVLRITIDSSSERRSNLNNEDTAEQEFEIDGNPVILSRHSESGYGTLLYLSEYAAIEVYSLLPDDELLEIAKQIEISLIE